MKMRNTFALLMILVLVLSACAQATPEPTKAPEPTEPPAEKPTATPAVEAVELRFTYYADGNEADVMRPILDKFEAANPGVTVILDVVPYSTIDEQLPVQVETGEGPDLARITNFGAYRGKRMANWQQALARLPLRFAGYGTKHGKPLAAAHNAAAARKMIAISIVVSVLVLAGLALLLIPALTSAVFG